MKKKKITLFIIMFLVALVMCSGYVTGHFSTDDYHIFNIGYNNYSLQNNLVEGRLISFLVLQLFSLFKININLLIISTVILAIALTIINVFLVYDLIQDYFAEKDYFLLYIILFFTFFNFMYLENLYYVESFVMSLSLVFYTLSCKYYFKKDKYSFIKSLLFNTLAIISYNGFECYFIVMITLLSLLREKKIDTKIFINIIQAGLIVVFTVLINLIQINICENILNFHSMRLRGFLFKNILTIIYTIPDIIINTCGLFHKYLFFICLMFLLILSFIYDVKSLRLFYRNLFLTIICICSSFAISIFSLSSFNTGRLSFGVGMTIGILLLNILFTIRKDQKRLRIIIIAFTIFWFSINSCNYCYRTLRSKSINDIEKKDVLELKEVIKEYEKDNSIKVDTLICIYDFNGRNVSVIDTNALDAQWSASGVIYYYSNIILNEKFISLEEMKKYSKKMKNKYLFEDNKLLLRVNDW